MAKQQKQKRPMSPEAKAEKLKKFKETLERNKALKEAEGLTATESIKSEKPIIVKENKTDKITPTAEDIIAEQKAFIERQTEINERLLKSIEELKAAKPEQAPVQTTQIITQSGEVRANQKFGKSLRKEIEPSDRLPLPETFVCLGGLFPMNVYMKNGSEVYPPLDKEVVFKPNFSEKKMMSDGTMKDCIYSLYSTSSKKEAQYVRESPHFGNYIFDNQTEAVSVNYELVEKIKVATEIVNKYNDMQLTQEASRYQIKTEGVSADIIRDNLKNIKVSEIIETEGKETQLRIQRLRVHETVNNGQ